MSSLNIMRNLLIMCAIYMTVLQASSQTSFEPGYFIDNMGSRVDCMLKNRDWRNNPVVFEYRTNVEGPSDRLTIEDVMEFGIDEVVKYERKKVNIDRSSQQLADLPTSGNPKFEEEILFLKKLIEGQANLYAYKDKAVSRYFFNKLDEPIEQLVFIKFRTSSDQLVENNQFKRQLLEKLACSKIDRKFLSSIGYNDKDLTEVIQRYNEFVGETPIKFGAKKRTRQFHTRLRPGINHTALSVAGGTSLPGGFDFDRKVGYRVGVELEYLLPFNNGKWALILEPTYQRLRNTGQLSIQEISVEYASLETPVGARYYSFLSGGTRIFANAAFLFDFPIKSTIAFERSTDLDVSVSMNPVVGLGAAIFDRYTIEIRYYFARNITNRYLSWESNYRALSLIVGVNIF